VATARLVTRGVKVGGARSRTGMTKRAPYSKRLYSYWLELLLNDGLLAQAPSMASGDGSPGYKAGKSWRGKVSNGHDEASTRSSSTSPSRTRPSPARSDSPSRAKVNDFMGWDATEAGPDERKAPMPFNPKLSVVHTTIAMRQRVLREVFGLIDDDCSGHLDTAELLSLGEAMGQTPRETEMLLRTMDKDHGGKVSLEEFVSGFMKSMPSDPHKFHAQSHRMRSAAQTQSARRAAQRAIPNTTCYECLFQAGPGSCGQPKMWPGVYMTFGYLWTLLLLILAPFYSALGSHAFWIWLLLLLGCHTALVLLSDHGADLPVNIRLAPTWLLYSFDWLMVVYLFGGPYYVSGFTETAKVVYPCLGVLAALVQLLVEPFPYSEDERAQTALLKENHRVALDYGTQP